MASDPEPAESIAPRRPLTPRQALRARDLAAEALVLADPHLLLREDRTDETCERRWRSLGVAGGLGALLIVVHVYMGSSDGEEIIRILSARKAGPRERRTYLQ